MFRAVRYLALSAGIAVAVAVTAGDERFPVQTKLPRKVADATATLLDWQSSLVDLKAVEIQERLGKPDMVKDMERNSASGKPMQVLSYRVSRRSKIQFTIHEEEVVAVTTLLLPSANENGPIDD